MSEKQILDFKPLARLEQVSDHSPKQLKDLKHRPDDAPILLQCANPAGWDFRERQGQSERYAKIASEFVALKVDLIVTWASAPVLAAKRATGVIPIVFAAQMDPVSVGVVASLSRPGGNVTGLSLQQTDTTSKRLELLREALTNLRRLAIMGNVDTPGVVLEMGEIEKTARALGIEITILKLRSAENIAPAIESVKGRADALYIATDPLVLSNRAQIAALSTEARLPTIFGSREYVEAGGLMSYGPNYPDLFRRAAELADKILRGAKPAGGGCIPFCSRCTAITSSSDWCVFAQDLQPGLLETFRDELHKLGYVEGANLIIELRNAAGQNDRLPALAEELLRLQVDVIVAVNTPAAQAAKRATQTVPVVMMRVADPVKSGLVTSLSHPGGNVTGLSFMPDALGPKGVELMHEILPDATRMAALYQGDNAGSVVVVDEVQRKGGQLGLEFVRLPVHEPNDYAPAFEKAAGTNCKALFVMDDGAITKHRQEILERASGTNWSRKLKGQIVERAAKLLALLNDLMANYQTLRRRISRSLSKSLIVRRAALKSWNG